MFFVLMAMQKRRNRKGWLHILEASISMMIILTFVVLSYSWSIEKTDPGESILVKEKVILESARGFPFLREAIINKPETTCRKGGELYNFTKERVQGMMPGMGFTCRVCEPDSACGMPVYRTTPIYSEQIIISCTLTKFSPKKVRLFVWPLKRGEPPEVPEEENPCWRDWTAWGEWECRNGINKSCRRDNHECPSDNTADCKPDLPPCTVCMEQRIPCEDTTAPEMISMLNCHGLTGGFVPSETITCTWAAPTDLDFNESIVYVNQVEIARAQKGQETYIKTGITSNVPNTYKIKILTKDNTGNVNDTIVGNNKSCDIQPSQNKYRAFCS